ncbi:MAG: YggS family pyridoxal phosphate-dependent enzyme [Spirochaetales bacterium]|nr:YggS family pyridoxal phosphate-dependent enzyme [Spirochaetales bacterium]
MEITELKNNIETVYENIEKAAVKAGRQKDEIRLMAVTKTFPLEYVNMAYSVGLKLFGENRVYEAYEKYIQLDKPVELHLIGHLQRNKAKTAVKIFQCVESIDHLETAQTLDKRCKEIGRTMKILLEINTSGEESKHGFKAESDYFKTLDKILLLTSLKPMGLMTVGPLTDDKTAIHESFSFLKKLFEKTKRDYADLNFTTLSMGMSGDYEIAVEEGSNLLRIGTALFGNRG